MTHEFKAGDKVRYTAEFNGAHTHNVKQGDVREVARISSAGHVLLVPEPGDTHGPRYAFAPRSFEPVPSWSDIEVGDKVTVRIQRSGEELTTTAYADDEMLSGVGLLGEGRNSYRLDGAFDLLSIEKPKPAPPTTPGSHVTVPYLAWESSVNHLFLLDGGKWFSQAGRAYWPAEDVASKDFTVIHDAGAES
jgi:hypothetical protein